MTLEDEQALDIFGKALGTILKDTEGVCVDFEGSLYIVYREDGEVFIGPADDLFDGLTGKDLTAGMLVWMHKNETIV